MIRKDDEKRMVRRKLKGGQPQRNMRRKRAKVNGKMKYVGEFQPVKHRFKPEVIFVDVKLDARQCPITNRFDEQMIVMPEEDVCH